jgi:TolA-binding protein
MVGMARASSIGLIAFLVALSARAQVYGSAADVESFSGALLHANYADIAEEVVKSALERGVQDSSGLLAYSLCEITATVALRTSDVTQRIAKLKEAVAAYEEYLKKFPNTDRSAEARLKLSEWLRTAGEQAAVALKKETTPEKKEQLKNDGLNLFTKAEVQSKARIDAILKTPKDQMTDLQQAELKALRFAVARMPYSKAMLHENRTGVEAQSLLTEAQTLLEEFDLEYSLEILSFEARRIIALILIERGDLKGAEETIAYSCEQLAETDPSALKDVPDNQENRDLVAKMFLEKAEFLTRTKKPADWKAALETTEQLAKIVPELVKLRDGKQAMMIMAEALAEEGQTPKARTVAQQVYDHDPSGDAGLRAREMLDKLGTGGGGTDAASMVKLLAGTVDRKDIPASERMAARILSSPEIKNLPDVKADAMLQLGGLYYNTGLYTYAAVVFAAIADEFPGSARAPEAKYNEAMSYGQQSRLDGRQAMKYWRDRSNTAREDLNKRWPNSKEAKDVAWFAAGAKKDEEKFAEAAELYLKVPSTSPRHGEAQYEAGVILIDLGMAARIRNKPEDVTKRFQESESALKAAVAALEAAAKNTINPSELSRLKDMGFVARLRLVGLYIQKELRKPDDALKLLDEIEAAYKDDKSKLTRVWSLRIKTLILLGRGQEAFALLEKNQELANAETFVAVAAEIDGDAMDKLKASEKDPTVDEDLKVAGDLYSRAVAKATPGSKINWLSVGKRLLYIWGRLAKAPGDYDLMAIDANVAAPHKPLIDQAKKALEMAPPAAELDIDRQRALAFTAGAGGNWLDAISALREITNKLPLFTAQGKLDRTGLQQYAKLADVYQDLGVAHLRAAKGDKGALSDTAKEIFVKLVNNSEPTSRRYWEGRYLHLLALKEAKEYAELDSALDGLARTAPDADKNEFGIKTKIDEIRAFRDKKIINK